MGTASAKGEDMDDGVDDRVGSLLIICHVVGATDGAGMDITERSSLGGVPIAAGEEEAIGVGSDKRMSSDELTAV